MSSNRGVVHIGTGKVEIQNINDAKPPFAQMQGPQLSTRQFRGCDTATRGQA